MKSLFLPLVRLRPHPHHHAAAALRRSSTFHPSAPAPSPPRLPAKEQAEFERLQKLATSQILSEETTTTTTALSAEEKLPQIPTRMPAPEFEGDKNPRTGEVNGPKSEPLRWGSKGDWSYNGRVTDF